MKLHQHIRLLTMGLMATLLLACGGGGQGTSPSGGSTTTAVVNGTIAPGVKVIASEDIAQATLTAQADQTGIVVANPSGQLKAVQAGQIVYLPANGTQGIPEGYAGVAHPQNDGSVKLTPAVIEDVFTKLAVDYDSSRDGGQVAGLIVPKNGRMQLLQSQPTQAGLTLDYVSCMTGLKLTNDVKCKNGALEGSIVLEHPIKVKLKGGNSTAMAKVYAKVDLAKLSAEVKIDYDESKYASTGGFNVLRSVVTGEWGASMGIKMDDPSLLGEMPSWSEFIRGDEANIWDENTKLQFGKYFELSGLDGDDKKGMFPLGGFYITPGGLTPFAGDLNAAALGQIKALSVVVWIYMDLSGKIVVSGDAKLLEATGGGFKKGFEVRRAGNTLQTENIDVTHTPNVFVPRVEGSIEADQNVGLAVAADVLVSGIRPATLKAELLGFKVKGSVKGSGGYRLASTSGSGFEGALEGNVCIANHMELYSDVFFKTGIKAKLDSKWFSASSGVEYTLGPAIKTWWSKQDAVCVNNYTLPLSEKERWSDTEKPGNIKVEMTFEQAYQNANLRNQVGRWVIGEDGPLQSTQYDANLDYGGRFSVSLAPGKYSFVVVALHKELLDSSGNPVVLARSLPLVINISAGPIVDFTAALVGNDCKKLSLTSASTASTGNTLSQYSWTVTPQGGSPIIQQGASLRAATFTLPACGAVAVEHKVTDSTGISTAVSRNVNTSDLSTKVTGISPQTAQTSASVAFTVTGTNLPSTAVMSIADATCSSQSVNPSGTALTATCVMGTTTGDKVVTIKTNTQANDGQLIDDTRKVTVSTAPTTSKLPHSGITASQCYAAGSDTLVACSSTGATSLSDQQDGHRANINAMSYSKIGFSGEALADSASSWCAVKDNITGLMWENHQRPPFSYTNLGDNSAGDASKYAADNATLCGLSGWRLPTVKELQGIVDYSRPDPGPTINTTWFANTAGRKYWSSSPYVGYSHIALLVDFYYGYVDVIYRDYIYYVRLVR